MSKSFSNELSILVIDDEQSILSSLAGALEDEGCTVYTESSGNDGIEFLKRGVPVDLVFLDVWMPGIDGIETLQRIRAWWTDLPVIIMSGHATIETAVRATKLGATQFIEKPLSLSKIIPTLKQVDESLSERQKKGPGLVPTHQLIGQSEQINEIRQHANLVAPRDSWVLLTGENGTGKEIVANILHQQSRRASGPFIPVNCAAIPEELIESELFGHVKGAFTGAMTSKKGRFELADKGTLFLDEVGDMSLKTQAKILRVLQEQTFEKLGTETSMKVNVRVIAATNKNLKEEIKKGRFREDLYYRLNVIPIHLPPLRKREEDIIVLANYFLAENAKDLAEAPKVLTHESKEILLNYKWPGNVRELKNLIERLCIFVQGDRIEPSDLPSYISSFDEGEINDDDSPSLKQARNEFERDFIIQSLQQNQWNVSKTAEHIGVERSHLHKKIKIYEIDQLRPKKL